MALKTNQMQTDLQKYRDGWDFIFNKNNMNVLFVHQELKRLGEIGKAASISGGKLRKSMMHLAKSNENIITGILEKLSVISKAASFSEENKKAMMHLNDLGLNAERAGKSLRKLMLQVKESDNADRS